MEHTKPTRSRRPRVETIHFDIPINGRNYSVAATPFQLPSGERQFRVSYNQGVVHVFGWDDGLDRFAEMESALEPIPPVVEMAIADKLNECASQLQDAA